MLLKFEVGGKLEVTCDRAAMIFRWTCGMNSTSL